MGADLQIHYTRPCDKVLVDSLPLKARMVFQLVLHETSRVYFEELNLFFGYEPKLELFNGAVIVKLLCVAGVPIVWELEDRGIHEMELAQQV